MHVAWFLEFGSQEWGMVHLQDALVRENRAAIQPLGLSSCSKDFRVWLTDRLNTIQFNGGHWSKLSTSSNKYNSSHVVELLLDSQNFMGHHSDYCITLCIRISQVFIFRPINFFLFNFIWPIFKLPLFFYSRNE